MKYLLQALLPFLLSASLNAADSLTAVEPPITVPLQVYYLTSGNHQEELVQTILPNIKILAYDVPLIQEMDLRTIIKAQFKVAYEYREGIFIAEQSALALSALNGLPGPFYPWFQMQIGNLGISNLGISLGNTAAEIITIVGYAGGPEDIHFFEGRLKGKVVSPRGIQSANWESIFVPDGLEKTLSELDPLLKNTLNSRRFAFDSLRAYLNRPKPSAP